MKRNEVHHILSTIVVLFGLMTISTSCEKEMDGEIFQVSDEKMLDELMEDNQLSDFLAIVEKGELGGTIHAYGSMTLFAPTNAAVQTYLQSAGKGSVNDLTMEEAEALVKYHLVRDTLLTTDFVDGRLSSHNFLRKYLTTKTESDGADVYIRVNRQARIVTENVRGSNGYLHIVDAVLTPPVETVADRIAALPDDYSLMKALFNRAGLSKLRDSLSVERTDHWFTFFIQDNQAFKDAGIESVDDLLVQLRENSPAIDDDEELIYNYVAYHGANKLSYIADLLVASDLTTLAPKQVITLKRDLDKILLNEFVQDQTKEDGIVLDRTSEYSDWSCANGVIHKINGNIQIKNRSAYRIYWDIAEQPEIMSLKTFRKAGGAAAFAPGELADITWGGKTDEKINYYCGGYSTTLDEKFQYIYGDYLRFTMSTSTMQWIEFKTPVLVPGKYKVWLCYRREHDMTIKASFKQEGYDDQILPYNFDLAAYMPDPDADGSSHELIEIEGWKQYNAKKYNSVVIAHLLGTIVVEVTGRHTLRFDVVSSKHSYSGNWDMIQFIPQDEDQLWPRVDIKGNWFTADMRTCDQAWPPTTCEEETVEPPAE